MDFQSFMVDMGGPMLLGVLISFVIYFPFTVYLFRIEYERGVEKGKLEAENEQLKIRLKKHEPN